MKPNCDNKEYDNCNAKLTQSKVKNFFAVKRNDVLDKNDSSNLSHENNSESSKMLGKTGNKSDNISRLNIIKEFNKSPQKNVSRLNLSVKKQSDAQSQNEDENKKIQKEYVQILEQILALYSCIPVHKLKEISSFNFKRFEELKTKRIKVLNEMKSADSYESKERTKSPFKFNDYIDDDFITPKDKKKSPISTSINLDASKRTAHLPNENKKLVAEPTKKKFEFKNFSKLKLNVNPIESTSDKYQEEKYLVEKKENSCISINKSEASSTSVSKYFDSDATINNPSSKISTNFKFKSTILENNNTSLSSSTKDNKKPINEIETDTFDESLFDEKDISICNTPVSKKSSLETDNSINLNSASKKTPVFKFKNLNSSPAIKSTETSVENTSKTLPTSTITSQINNNLPSTSASLQKELSSTNSSLTFPSSSQQSLNPSLTATKYDAKSCGVQEILSCSKSVPSTSQPKKIQDIPLDEDGWPIYNPEDFEDVIFESEDVFNESIAKSVPETSSTLDMSAVCMKSSKPVDNTNGEFDGYHFNHSEVMREQFKHKFGLKSFRPNQLQVINAALLNNDCFVLMPTGGGKSLCYQLPAILTSGVTIVISPLKSLICDQVNKLESLDIPATHLSGTINENDVTDIFVKLSAKEPYYKLLYITPEKISLSSKVLDLIKNLYSRGKLARFVIDEAHCVSQWGHDFRPEYKKLNFLRTQFCSVPMMMLTATATPRVKLDIQKQLHIKNAKMFVCSFNRPNLKYVVLPKKGKAVIDEIVQMIKNKFSSSCGIIYCFSRKDCEEVAQNLMRKGIKACAYHAGLSDTNRERYQRMWIADQFRVVCATIAFGMGIDKPDVRFVMHHTLPKSIEGYYQESGRAGRDYEPATCILYYSYTDVIRIRRMIERSDNSTRESLKTHVDNLKYVVHYCENQMDCRRAIQLNYFGELFNREECLKYKNTTCDNCLNSKNYELVDVTEHCQAIATCVRDICQNGRFTMLHLVEIFKGSKLKKVIDHGHNKHPLHGRGADWVRADIQRLFHQMVHDEYLGELIYTNNDIPTAYLKLGPKVNTLMNGSVKVKFAMSQKHSKLDDVQCEKSKETVKNNKDECYEELVEACRNIAAEKNVTLASVMHMQALKTMSENLPMSEQEMLEIPYVTKAKFEKYGKTLLDITTKYACMLLVQQETEQSSNANKSILLDVNEDDWDCMLTSPQASGRGRKRRGSGRSAPRKKRIKRGSGQTTTWKKTGKRGGRSGTSSGFSSAAGLGLMCIPNSSKK